MGGDDDVPPAPDYGPLIEASKVSSKFAYDLAKEQFEWAKKTYADNKATSKIVIDKALGMMDRQDAWAQADRKRYEEVFQPLEEQLAVDAQDFNTTERQEQEAGKAEADVAAQFEQARDTARQRLEAYGVDPSQTRQGALDLGTRVAEAAAQASAGNQARDRTMREGWALRDAAINAGKGLPAQVMGEIAGSGQSGNQSVNTGLATTASGAQTMGTSPTWQGLGNQAVGMWGNILNTGFGNEMDRYKAEQDSSSGVGTMLGAGAGLLTAFLEEGGAIPDPNAQPHPGAIPAEMSPSGGAIPDDIDAQIQGSDGSVGPAKLNAGEFVFPKDVMAFKGEEWAQKEIIKARKAMSGANGDRPAQPTDGKGQQMPPMESVGAIPTPA